MAGNPLSGHTKANMTLSGSAQPADGLTDGDHILSPTLTNFLEGIHGNGIPVSYTHLTLPTIYPV